MNNSESQHDTIAARAYRLWEERGRPAGRDLDFWLEAEAEGRGRTGTPGQEQGQPEPTNLERALSPGQRQRARAARRSGGDDANPMVPPPEHFVVVLDRAHLNIYQVKDGDHSARVHFEPIQKVNLPAGRRHYTDRDSDQAGRFRASVGPSGGSIDERLPMQNEHERALAADLAERLGRFLQEHDHATWDYAAGPALHRAVLDRLPPTARARLERALAKELVHQSPAELEAHFTP